MEQIIYDYLLPFVKNIILAIIVLVVGLVLVRLFNRYLPKSKLFQKLDPSARSFILSTIKILLYIFLIIIIITVLGVPTASIVAALTSAFLAIGLALQGALSNFAGGIMILLFRPFVVGDYITCSGGTGTVKGISVFYTSIITDDNNRITVPNGTLMNDSVGNHTVEGTRRVEIKFVISYGTDDKKLKDELLRIAVENSKVMPSPAPEFIAVEYLDNGVRYSLRMWCSTESYWNVYFDAMSKTNAVLKELGVSAPTSKVNIDVINK